MGLARGQSLETPLTHRFVYDFAVSSVRRQVASRISKFRAI